MKILCMITLYLLFSQFSYGKNRSAATNTLTFSTGFNYVSLKDRTFSPIVFTGVTPKISLEFSQNRSNNKLWNISIAASTGNINHNNNYFSSSYTSAQLAFNYLSIIKFTSNSKLYFGGQLRSNLDLLNYSDFSSGGWFTAQHLEPILIYKYGISEKQSITGQFSYPILSLVSRPNYAGVDEFVVANANNIPDILYSDEQVLSLRKIVNPNFQFIHSYGIKNFSASISVNYSYLQVNSIRKYYKNELGVNLGLQIYLGKNNAK